jgi:2-polyprenyl-3-methyl-5-hydroxy-6-metoxy-1,4-benzoquinol methylase
MYNQLDLTSIPETTYGFRNRARFVIAQIGQLQSQLGRPVDVLDVGCGTGDLVTVWVARLGAQVLGIDTHEPSIGLARSRYDMPNLRFELATAEDVLSSGKTFDAIICSEVLEHLYNPETLLNTLRKLIRPRGLCLVTIPNGWGPKENEERLVAGYIKMKSLIRRQTPRGGHVKTEDAGESVGMIDSLNYECGHVQFYTMGTMQKLAKQTGFRIEKQENRRFLSGPISDRLIGNNQHLVNWNVRVARTIPYWLASSWMFVFRPV